MEGVIRECRLAARALLRSRGFALVAVATLALGLGASIAIFTVVAGVLLRPLPYPRADRIVRLWEVGAKGGRMNASDPDFTDVQEGSRAFAALAEVADWGVVSVSGGSQPVRASTAAVSARFFDVMGVRAEQGRTFVPEEQRPGGRPAVVVSDGFWRGALGSAPLERGITLDFDGGVYAVVGVMPRTLDYPVGASIWLPRELEAPDASRTAHNWWVLGRLAPGVSLERARGDVSALARRLKARYGDETDMADAALVPLRDQLVGQVRPALLVLFAASGVLLLIACANVVNLMIARMAARQGEQALRIALGATRARLALHFVAEALLLAITAGVLGILLASLAVRTLIAVQPSSVPRLGDIRVDGVVLAFAAGVVLLAALAMGLAGAWRASQSDVRATLAQASRTIGGGGMRLRRALVAAQVAGTLVLLVAAGLLGRSFLKLVRTDPGFRTERALVLDVSLPFSTDSSALVQTVRFYDELMERLRHIPGVESVGGVNALPLDQGGPPDGTFLELTGPADTLSPARMERLFRDPSRTGHAEYVVASAGYFRTLGIPLIRGRLFDDRDAPDAPHVALVSQSLATRRWPGENPLGKVIEFGNMDGDLRPFTVVGVVGDVRDDSLGAPPYPTVYADYRQRPRKAADFNVIMRGDVERPAVIAAARGIVHALRPDVPPRFRTIEAVVSASVADRRFLLMLTGVFGGAAVLLATLGVYGLISYFVALRRHEFGIRIALGAQGADVQRLVLQEGVVLALGGIAAGTLAALALTRLIRGLLYGVSATDPVAFVVVAAALAGVVLLASAVPARRATRVDPMRVLRSG